MSLYKERYDKIIQHYQNIVSEGYVEKHHIIPKCKGGSDNLENLVALPARAHFICHYLLHKMYPEDKSLAQAFAMMTIKTKRHKGRRCSSRMYELGKIARSNSLKGVPRPEWVKAKLRKPKRQTENYKKPKSKEHAENISKALKGVAKSKQHIENSKQACKSYHENRTREAKKKRNYYRNLFIESEMSRKEFSEKHNLSYSTVKRYCSGL